MISKIWQAGDKVSFTIPMEIQQITAADTIEADRKKIALRYGPLIYTVEEADQQDIHKKIDSRALETQWRDDMFGGIMTLTGKWEDGSTLTAIPYYSRNNRYISSEESDRNPKSMVWINQ
jgi:hypothetical protein